MALDKMTMMTMMTMMAATMTITCARVSRASVQRTCEWSPRRIAIVELVWVLLSKAFDTGKPPEGTFIIHYLVMSTYHHHQTKNDWPPRWNLWTGRAYMSEPASISDSCSKTLDLLCSERMKWNRMTIWFQWKCVSITMITAMSALYWGDTTKTSVSSDICARGK